MIRKEAWSFYRTDPGVRLCWELEEPTLSAESPLCPYGVAYSKVCVFFDSKLFRRFLCTRAPRS